MRQLLRRDPVRKQRARSLDLDLQAIVPMMEHLLVERGHSHPTDNVVGGRLIAVVDDIAFPFGPQHGLGRRRAVLRVLQFRAIDGRLIKFDQRALDFGHMRADGAGEDVSGIGHGRRFKFRIAREQMRL